MISITLAVNCRKDRNKKVGASFTSYHLVQCSFQGIFCALLTIQKSFIFAIYSIYLWNYKNLHKNVCMCTTHSTSCKIKLYTNNNYGRSSLYCEHVLVLAVPIDAAYICLSAYKQTHTHTHKCTVHVWIRICMQVSLGYNVDL